MSDVKNNKSNKNKISEIKKLSIDSTLWAKPTEIVLLDDIDLNKLSIKGKYISKHDLIDYTVRYDGDGFWLTINDLEGYFDFNNNKDNKKNRLNSDDLPSGNKFKISTITIVIKSMVKKDSKYYLQISLNNCTHKT